MTTRTRTALPSLAWARSSRSNPGGECVELAALPDGDVAVRNSRDPDGLWLWFDQDAIRAFIAGAKAGDFDHLPR